MGTDLKSQDDSLDSSVEDAKGRQQQVQKKILKCIYWALIQNEDEYRIDIGKIPR